MICEIRGLVAGSTSKTKLKSWFKNANSDNPPNNVDTYHYENMTIQIY